MFISFPAIADEWNDVLDGTKPCLKYSNIGKGCQPYFQVDSSCFAKFASMVWS